MQLILLLLLPAFTSGCEQDWTEFPQHNICVKLFQEDFSWYRAKNRCISYGGKLVEAPLEANSADDNYEWYQWRKQERPAKEAADAKGHPETNSADAV